MQLLSVLMGLSTLLILDVLVMTAGIEDVLGGGERERRMWLDELIFEKNAEATGNTIANAGVGGKAVAVGNTVANTGRMSERAVLSAPSTSDLVNSVLQGTFNHILHFSPVEHVQTQQPESGKSESGNSKAVMPVPTTNHVQVTNETLVVLPVNAPAHS